MTANDTAPYAAEWTTVAPGWDANRGDVEATKAEITKRLVTGLDLHPGATVLELGAGTGEFARSLSAAVGDAGRVLATDCAQGMVDLVAATTRDLANVHTAKLDATDIGHRDALFDGVAFRFGLMLVPDPSLALDEVRRVLRPGGRFVAATWSTPEHNMWLVSVGMSAMLNGMVSGPMPTEPGGPLSLGDPDALEKLARNSGFHDVTVERADVMFHATDVDAHIAQVTSLAPPLKAGYEAATPEQRVAFRASVADLTKQFQTESGLAIPGQALLLVAA